MNKDTVNTRIPRKAHNTIKNYAKRAGLTLHKAYEMAAAALTSKDKKHK